MPKLITFLIVVTCLFLIFMELLRNKLSTTKTYPDKEQISKKTRLTTLLLCVFFGFIGLHRFYVRKAGTACLMIFTGGGLGFWTMFDTIFIIMGRFTDIEGKQVFNWTENND